MHGLVKGKQLIGKHLYTYSLPHKIVPSATSPVTNTLESSLTSHPLLSIQSPGPVAYAVKYVSVYSLFTITLI